ncbi:hypothetical protein [Bradyrhizobium sp. CCBAU 53421]|uniref:DUF6894 family protein n=1 Tax=Bradyrhizobium sp. CCBAU 53421 TaxID=1325120 RepID=UPI00188A622A|nr:hypothetical protein [Bradyrhizobium sp. CCBAU 53421]QOZ32824.1 hypothetical protein XH92_14935 [Bradyrhizobium sp. CCBAU 53421]
MALYFFDIQSGREFFADEEGRDLPEQRFAEIEAMEMLVGMLKNSTFANDRPDMAIEVRSGAERLFCASLIYRKNGTKH